MNRLVGPFVGVHKREKRRKVRSMSDVTDEAMNAVVAEILDHDDLVNDPDWTTYALVAEVTDDSEVMAAFRYTEAGPPVPSQTLVDSRPLRRVRDATRGADEPPWRVCIVKIRRDPVQATWEFLTDEGATSWEVTTKNYQNLAHGLRPQPGDFQPP